MLNSTFDGLAFDPLNGSFRVGGPRAGTIPGSGRIDAVEHISVLHSIRERGLAWVTTKGMEKFGLPNLEVLDVPPQLQGSLGPIINALAQTLIDRVLDLADRSATAPSEIALEPVVALKALSGTAGAKGAEPADRRPVDVLISWTGLGRGRQEPFISLEPPKGFEEGRGVWFHRLVQDFVGGQPPGADAIVDGAGREAALAEAHRKVIATLPGVGERFRRGLRPGEVLYIKRGFPHEKGMEYMWVAVSTWKGIRLQGQLTNEPVHCKDLQQGDPIELDQDEVLDWVIEGTDGRTEGGFTNAALQGGEAPKEQ